MKRKDKVNLCLYEYICMFVGVQSVNLTISGHANVSGPVAAQMNVGSMVTHKGDEGKK